MPVTPFASVIIPSAHEADVVARCLDSLACQTYPTERFEILLVDNHAVPDAGLADLASRFANVRLLHEPKQGSSRARNCGLSAARGEIIAFVDADCVCDDDWLESGVHTLLASPERTLLGGHMRMTAGDPTHPGLSEQLDMLLYFQQQRCLSAERFLVTANLFLRAADAAAIGPFDTRQLRSEDEEWCRRAWRSGYRLLLDPAVGVTHPALPSVGRAFARMSRNVRGKADLYWNEGAVTIAAFFHRGAASFRAYAAESRRRLREMEAGIARKSALVTLWFALHVYAAGCLASLYAMRRWRLAFAPVSAAS